MAADTDARRFRVLADAFYVRHGDGVWLRNNIGSFSIQGAGAYQLVDTLFANLDGTRGIDELTEGLPAAARSSVVRLVATLERNGFVKPVEYPAEPVPDWMRDRYPAHLAFLEHHGDRPVTRMARVRSRQVVAAGEGVALRGLLGALGEFGVAKVLVVTTEAGADLVADVVEQARVRDPELRWRVLVPADDLDLAQVAALPEVARAAQVLLAVDHGDCRALADCQRTLTDSGQQVGVLARCGDYVVAVPPSTDGGRCVECVHRSVARQVNGAAADLPPSVAPATIGALHVAQHAFATLAGIELDGRDRVTSVEPIAPVVRTHVAHRHPSCGRHGPAPEPVPLTDPTALPSAPVRPDIAVSNDSDELVAVADRIVAVTAAWTDQVTGPLLALGEDDLPQLPLSASSCLLADPVSTADRQVTRRFECAALAPREARNQVVLFALEWFAGRLIGAVGHYGAGWTAAEAWYRAQVAVTLGLPMATPEWARVAQRRWTTGPVREFLTGTLAGAGRAWCAQAVEQSPTGLVRATVRTSDDGTWVGAGIDEDHAVDNALLGAVAGGRVAQLAPPLDSWADAVAVVAKQGGDADVVDVSSALPFLGGDAVVVRATRSGDGA